MLYRAFISYSQQVDRRLGTAMAAALTRFAKPWYKLRNIRIFRDETDLGVAPRLWSNIRNALDESEFLILLASPAAAKSPWIDREVEHWLSTKGPETLLVVLTDGLAVWDRAGDCFDAQRSTAIPARLCKAFSEEPFYLDMRWARSAPTLSLREPRFLDQIATLAATLHGRSKAELASMEVREHSRTMRIAWSAAMGLAVLALLATGLAFVAQTQRNEAEAQRIEAQAQSKLAKMNSEIATAKQREAELTLARSDFLQGAKQVSDDQASLALPRLGRSLLLDPLKPATAIEMVSLLAQRWFPRIAAEGPVLSGAITSIRFSRSGQFLAATSLSELQIWDARSGRPVIPPFKSSVDITHAEFSSDENWLVLTTGYGAIDGPYGEVHLWNLRAPDQPHQTIRVDGLLWSAKFAPDGKSIATASAFGIAFWSLPAMKSIGRPLDFRDVRKRVPDAQLGDNTFTDFAFVSEGAELIAVTGFNTGVVARWNIRSRSIIEIRPLPSLPGLVNIDEASSSLLLSFPHDFAADYGNSPHEGYAVLFDSKALTRKWASEPYSDLIGDIKFLPHGQRIFFAENNKLHFLEASSGTSVAFDGEHGDKVTGIDVAPNGLLTASGAKDGTARVWTALDPEIRSEVMMHSSPVSVVQFDPAADHLATGTDSGRVLIWDIRPRRSYPLRLDNGSPVKIAELSGDGSRLTTYSSDRAVRIWDADIPQLLAKFETGTPAQALEEDVENDGVNFYFAPRTGILVLSDGRRMRLIEPRSGASITDWLDLGSYINQISFDEQRNRFLTATEAGNVDIWDLNTGTHVGDTLKHPNSVKSAVFLPDGNVVAAFAEKIVLWDPNSRLQLKLARNVKPDRSSDLEGKRPPQSVVDLQVTPDGKRILAVYGTVGTVLDVKKIRGKFVPDQIAIWTADLGLVADIGDDVSNELTVFTLSIDGKYVAIGCRDGSARVWSMATGESVGRPLTNSFVVQAIEFTGANDRLVVSGKSDRVVVWRGWTGEATPATIATAGMVQQIVTGSPDGVIATLSRSGAIQLWEEESAIQLSDRREVGDGGGFLAASVSGETFAAVDKAGQSLIWRLPLPKDDLERCTLVRTAGETARAALTQAGDVVPFEGRLQLGLGYLERCKGRESTAEPLRQWLSLSGETQTIAPGIPIKTHDYLRKVLASGSSGSDLMTLMLENPTDTCAQSKLASALSGKDQSAAAIGKYLARRLGPASMLNGCN